MTLRLTQCHQNWLTMMAESEGFEPSKYSSIPTENTTFLKFVSNFVSKNAVYASDRTSSCVASCDFSSYVRVMPSAL